MGCQNQMEHSMLPRRQQQPSLSFRLLEIVQRLHSLYVYIYVWNSLALSIFFFFFFFFFVAIFNPQNCYTCIQYKLALLYMYTSCKVVFIAQLQRTDLFLNFEVSHNVIFLLFFFVLGSQVTRYVFLWTKNLVYNETCRLSFQIFVFCDIRS